MAKLHFYYSAMNAGKTTILLQANYNYRERGMQTLLYTPQIDDRYEAGMITSRIGLNAEAIMFDDKFSLYEDVRNHIATNGKYNCIFIDEAQFLTKNQVQQLTEIVDDFNIPVLAYGLRTDFQGQPFEGSLYLLAWAEDMNEIRTICHCGSKATMCLRLDESGEPVLSGEQIEIGGNDSYVSVCRKHYKAAQKGICPEK